MYRPILDAWRVHTPIHAQAHTYTRTSTHLRTHKHTPDFSGSPTVITISKPCSCSSIPSSSSSFGACTLSRNPHYHTHLNLLQLLPSLRVTSHTHMGKCMTRGQQAYLGSQRRFGLWRFIVLLIFTKQISRRNIGYFHFAKCDLCTCLTQDQEVKNNRGKGAAFKVSSINALYKLRYLCLRHRLCIKDSRFESRWFTISMWPFLHYFY